MEIMPPRRRHRVSWLPKEVSSDIHKMHREEGSNDKKRQGRKKERESWPLCATERARERKGHRRAAQRGKGSHAKLS